MNLKLIIFVIFFTLLFDFKTVMANNSLYVFYPTDIRPNKMEQHITHHCPEIDITVFGKIKDFEEQTQQIPPDAILSYSAVIKKNRNYSSLIQGFKQGKTEESYVLVSLEKPINIKQLSLLKIGVLDILGRQSMKSFVNKKLGTKVKISRVTKTEDILNLLTFGLVDAIFISQQRFEKFRTQSHQALVSTQIDVKIDLAILAVKNNESKNLFLTCFNRLGKKTNSLLGVDQWALIPYQSSILFGEALWALK